MRTFTPFKGDSFFAALWSIYFTCTFSFFARSSIPFVISNLLGSSSFKDTAITVLVSALVEEVLLLFPKRACRPQPVIVKLRHKEKITKRDLTLFVMQYAPFEARSLIL